MKNKNENPKIAVIIGTRAQIIKTAPVMKELQDRGIDYRFVFTEQHKETMDDIMQNFGLKKPDYMFFSYSEEKADSRKGFGGWFFQAFKKIIFKRKEILPFKGGIVLSHGDTFTCWMGAILGKITGNKVMHLESGLRSFNLLKPFPEEISRLITFRFTDVYMAPNEWALNNLKKYKGVKINTGMNTQYDSVRIALQNEDKIMFQVPDTKYIVASIHRYEHVFKEEKFIEILEIIEMIAEKYLVVFVLHPVTIKRIKEYGLEQRFKDNKNIKLQERLPFFEFIKLLNSSEFVVTDGGSNQEELSYMGKPTLILRDVTERIEGLDENAVLAKFDKKVISDFVENYKKYEKPFKEVDVTPSTMIVNWLVDNGYADNIKK